MQRTHYLIGTVLETDLLSSVKKAQYMSVLSDGSTDVTNVEKELIYITFVEDSLVTTKLLDIRDVRHADAAGCLSGLTLMSRRNLWGFVQMAPM